MSFPVSGTVKPGFEPVAEAFALGFAGLPEMGAGLHILKDGETVVDLWGGLADARSRRAWNNDTPSVVFSCTKGLVSILIARLVAEGRLDYAAPVSLYWPEFAAAGKEGVTVAQALSHRAGLSAPRLDLSEAEMLDWDRMVAVLADQSPLWPLGSGYAYHAITHGWLAGELIRRVTGQSVGAYFRDVIAAPLGLDAWIGLPADMADRPAHIGVGAALHQLWADEGKKPEPNWPYKAMTLGHALPVDLVTPDEGFNAPHVRAAEIPGAGGIASAQALATIWSATVAPTHGLQLLDRSIIATATEVQSQGAPVFPAEPPYCAWGMGFQLDSPARRYLTGSSFGHDGAGGQVGFADPVHRVGFGFVTNWMVGPNDERATRIIAALQTLLA